MQCEGDLSKEKEKSLKRDGMFPREQVMCIFFSERKAANMYEKSRGIS